MRDATHTKVNLKKSTVNKDLHIKLPIRSTDTAEALPSGRDLCLTPNINLEFARLKGREDNMLLKTTEMYRNIQNENKKMQQ